ncbi:MAG: hypothetical protein AB1813_22510 [Verrucomicrobiota bacterium]|jgi:hypothetical protein
MAKKGYIPDSEANQLLWIIHFVQVLLGLLNTLTTITQAEANQVATEKDNFQEALNEVTAAKAQLKSTAENKDAIRAQTLSLIRKLVRKIKLDPAYTPAIGESLGIIGPEENVDVDNAKPVLTGEVKPNGEVELGFNKQSFQGVAIYSRRDTETQFTFLARDTFAPYNDNRPCLVAGKPEMREYRAIYLQGDEEVGQFSDVLIVVCQP